MSILVDSEILKNPEAMASAQESGQEYIKEKNGKFSEFIKNVFTTGEHLVEKKFHLRY